MSDRLQTTPAILIPRLGRVGKQQSQGSHDDARQGRPKTGSQHSPAAAESRMNQDMTLEAAAAATGQSVNRLRAWCATGELRCDRDGDGWALPTSELARLGALVAQRDATFAAGYAHG